MTNHFESGLFAALCKKHIDADRDRPGCRWLLRLVCSSTLHVCGVFCPLSSAHLPDDDPIACSGVEGSSLIRGVASRHSFPASIMAKQHGKYQESARIMTANTTLLKLGRSRQSSQAKRKLHATQQRSKQ